MANVKISDLAAFAAPAADDVFPIVDTSADSTKKVTITTLMRSAPDGTASAPSIAFRNDRNTGFYTPAGNEIGFVTGGVQRLLIDATGNIGIGTGSPAFNYGGGLEIQRTGNATLRLQRTDADASAFELACTSGVVRLDTRTSSATAFHTAGTERMRIDSSGRLLVGTTSAVDTGATSSLQVVNTSTAIIALARNDSSISAGNDLGAIRFYGNDGGSYQQCAEIVAEADGAHANNDKPSRLVFSTTADSGSSPTERMRIDSNGVLISSHATINGGVIGTNGNELRLQSDINANGNPFTSFYIGSSERMRIDSSGRMLHGVSASVNVANLAGDLQVHDDTSAISAAGFANTGTSCGYLALGKSRSTTVGTPGTVVQSGDILGEIRFAGDDGTDLVSQGARISAQVDGTPGSNDMPGRLVFSTTADGASSPSERMRITSNGNIGFIGGNTSASSSANRAYINASTGVLYVGAGGTAPGIFNRNTNDGNVVQIRQANTTEGNISVSGNTVSLVGAHLSRWSQLAGNAERVEILRGSVLSNLDEMCEWNEEDNEQLNRMKVSDVEGDVNVAGVFQDWDDDDDTYLNDFHCAMTGDFVIRIAQGTTVARGDLLMSAGDGTAKPQDDDIVRSKTVAKVTSTTVSATYADGSYCVPCVLMAC